MEAGRLCGVLKGWENHVIRISIVPKPGVVCSQSATNSTNLYFMMYLLELVLDVIYSQLSWVMVGRVKMNQRCQISQLVWWSACFQALVPWPRSRTNNTWRAKWLRRRYHAVVLHTDGHTRGKWSTRQPAKICQVVVLQVERLQRRSFHMVHKVLHSKANIHLS